MTERLQPARWLPQLAALVLALLFSAGIISALLLVSDIDPGFTFQRMFEYGFRPDSVAAILDKTTYYYLAGIAVAIGFRMALFNIGVDGQYRLAALAAALVGGASWLDWLPGPLRIVLMIVAAMAVGGVWAGIAGLLKVTRGVSEVISTIMLNFIAGGFIAYLVTEGRLAVRPEGSNVLSTPPIPESAWMPDIPLIPGSQDGVFGFIVIAALVGFAYWFTLERTRFGFDLRASGLNPWAATASGVDAKRMVIATMVISGAAAGLVGMPQLLGETHAYTQEFGGVGFTGIAIALLGRNRPIGIAFGALLWSFLERSSLILDLEDIPKETVVIMQGVTVLAVVVAYEVATRISRRAQQKRVGAATGQAEVVTPDIPAEIAAAPGVDVSPLAVDGGRTQGETKPGPEATS